MKYLFASMAAVSTLVLGPQLAEAGKKNGTVVIALQEPHASIDEIHQPSAEVQVMSRQVFDRLMTFDGRTGKFLPSLATSWKQINPTTWEFTLRSDVKWHDGQPLTAEDAVYTMNYASNPKVRLRLKTRFTWMKKATAVNPTTLRLETKRPYAVTIPRLAVGMGIIPKHIHEKLENKKRFGAKPVGSGPYRPIRVDKNKGVSFVLNEIYKHGNRARPAGKIKRAHFIPVPDEQSTMAQLLTGSLDVARVFNKDLAVELSARPGFAVKAVNSFRYYDLTFDAVGRSDAKALSNLKVRQAIAHAINRKELRESVIAGGKAVLPINAPCLPKQFGCNVDNAPPEYSMAKAKALLAEAGHGGGFDVAINSMREGKSVAETIAGYLRAVGIRASVAIMPRPAFLKARAQGKRQLGLGIYGSGGVPDVANVMSFFFAKSPRDYYRDPVLRKLEKAGKSSFDVAGRAKMYRQAMNLNNDKVYVLPIASAPTLLVHTKELNIPRDFSTNAYGLPLSTASWN